MENISPFLGTLIGNVIIAVGIILVVLITKFFKNVFQKYLEYITATTVGLLLGIIFLGFIGELTEDGDLVGSELGIFILIGIFIFYLLELFLHWHHCKDLGHEKSCHSHKHEEHNENKNGILMFGGTIMHNAFHGIVLFSAFSVNFSFGVATTVAVLLHSIPQNIVNYIMNHNNIKYAYFAAFGGLIGTFVLFPFTEFLIGYKFQILAIISGGLLYTALADIFPEFKGEGNTLKKLSYLFFILIGILLFFGLEMLSEHGHEDNSIVEKHEIHE